MVCLNKASTYVLLKVKEFFALKNLVKKENAM